MKRSFWLLGSMLLASGHLQAQDAEGSSAAAQTWDEWLHWKMFNLRPRFSGSAVFDDNINLSRRNEDADLAWYFTPGLSLSVGDALSSESKFMVLDYSPTVNIFTTHDEFNAVDQSANIRGVWPFAKLTLEAGASYNQATTPEISIGTRVDRSTYGVNLGARYQVSAKTTVEVNGSHSRADYEDRRFIGSSSWSNDNWIGYQIFPKLNLALGGTFGLLEVDRGNNQYFQRALLRGTYAYSAKLDVNVSAGGEWREYEGVSGTTVGPVFAVGAVYRPRDATSIGLTASRSEQNSPSFFGQNQVTTGVGLTVRQNVWRNLALNLGGSYQISEYNAAALGRFSVLRTDNYFMFRLGLDARFSQHWNGEIFVLHRESDSNNRGGVVFENNQLGLQTTYTF